MARPTSNVKTMQSGVRLPEDMVEWLRARAAKNDRRMGQELTRMLRPIMESDSTYGTYGTLDKAAYGTPDAATDNVQMMVYADAVRRT